jgi:DNA-binding NtrC family response regulator
MIVTGYPSIESAVEAVRTGAEDYLSKPFTEDELVKAVKRALKKLETRRMLEGEIDSEITETYGMTGTSGAIQEVRRAISKATQTPATVLITGESGTGKELVARAVHYNSSRASAPFVPVNCGGIPEGLLESELFGHVRGAFTGATETRAGFFQTADGGTIFLDEIGDTSWAMQVKLLRVLQYKEVVMVGDSRARQVDVRIIAASNKDLQALVQRELFREDLYFRLSVINIHVPPLRERGDDILMLARHFVSKYSNQLDRPEIHFSDSASSALLDYEWPGNIRELENVIQRLVIMSDEREITASDLPSLKRCAHFRGGGNHRSLADVEREHILNVLARVDGNKTRAAAILGIDRKTLREKLRNSKT